MSAEGGTEVFIHAKKVKRLSKRTEPRILEKGSLIPSTWEISEIDDGLVSDEDWAYSNEYSGYFQKELHCIDPIKRATVFFLRLGLTRTTSLVSMLEDAMKNLESKWTHVLLTDHDPRKISRPAITGIAIDSITATLTVGLAVLCAGRNWRKWIMQKKSPWFLVIFTQQNEWRLIVSQSKEEKLRIHEMKSNEVIVSALDKDYFIKEKARAIIRELSSLFQQNFYQIVNRKIHFWKGNTIKVSEFEVFVPMAENLSENQAPIYRRLINSINGKGLLS